MTNITAEEIRTLRESNGWTTTELAYHTGVTNDSVRKWERGERKPRGSAIKLLVRLIKKNGKAKSR